MSLPARPLLPLPARRRHRLRRTTGSTPASPRFPPNQCPPVLRKRPSSYRTKSATGSSAHGRYSSSPAPGSPLRVDQPRELPLLGILDGALALSSRIRRTWSGPVEQCRVNSPALTGQGGDRTCVTAVEQPEHQVCLLIGCSWPTPRTGLGCGRACALACCTAASRPSGSPRSRAGSGAASRSDRRQSDPGESVTGVMFEPSAWATYTSSWPAGACCR